MAETNPLLAEFDADLERSRQKKAQNPLLAEFDADLARSKNQGAKPASEASLPAWVESGIRALPLGLGAAAAGYLGTDRELAARARSGQTAKDAATDEGLLDRAGSYLERGGQTLFGGFKSALSPAAPSLRADARAMSEAANAPVSGDVSWEDVKANPSLANIGSFVVNRSLESAPGMGLAAVPVAGAPLYAVSNTGSIAQQRAQNDGREDPTFGDIAAAAPAGIASAALEKIGIGGILGATGKSAATRIGKAAATEAVTEFGQSSVEYAGGTAGTDKGFRLDEMLDQGLAGAVAGAGMGGTLRGGGEIIAAPFNRRAVAAGKTEKAVADVVISPDDEASPIPTETIAAGKAATAVAMGGKQADGILDSAGLPTTGKRVSVTLPDGKVKTGTITDAFDEDVDGERATGAVFQFDDGTKLREHFDTLADAGVVIREAGPLAEADANDAALAAMAQNAIAAASEADPQPVAVPSPVAAPATLAPTSTVAPSTFRMPVANARVSSKFGARHAPKKGASTMHGGIDFAVPIGTDVAAAAGGRVVAVGWDKKGGGNFVKIDHGKGLVTSYAHLKGATVKVGDAVESGQRVGLSGNTGNSTGPHLHFVARVNGKAVDPETLFGSNVSGGDVSGPVSGDVPQNGTVKEPVFQPEAIKFAEDQPIERAPALDQQERGAPIPVRAEEKADVAVTSNGREVPVRYGVVELGSLIASNDGDGRANPAYPQELQPRDRSRGISQAQITSIAGNLNPRLLGRTAKASDGAPIIAPDGVVESGNGRTLALRQAYANGGEKVDAYRQMIEQEGFDTTGMTQPVLVRIREGDMALQDVQAFTREANARDTLDMSGTEQAMADAAALDGGMLDLYRGGDIDAGANRDFVRRFLQGAVSSPNDFAKLIDSNGQMSQAAVSRVRGAMLAKAYDNAGLVEQAVESTDTEVKSIIAALTDVSGQWSQLREAVKAGQVDPDMDITENVNEAVSIVDRARREGKKVADLVNQRDIFSGSTVAPLTEAVLRLLFARPDFSRPIGRERMARALSYYATEAMKAQPGGASLFGDLPKVEPGSILDLARVKQSDGQADTGPDLLTAAAEAKPAEPAGLDTPDAGGGNARSGGESVPQDGGDQAGQSGEVSAPDVAAPDVTGGDLQGDKIKGEWVKFADDSGSLNIPRAEMPQIKAEHRGAMVNFLNARGIEHAEETIPADSLKPTQAEFSTKKVEKAKEYEGGDRAILISSDNHVVDGHHQWLAKRDNGEDIRAIRLKAPIKDVLATVAEFPSAETAAGATTAKPEAAAEPVAESRPKAPDTIIPAAEIRGQSIGVRRINAMRWYRDNLVGSKITAAVGKVVEFTNRGGKKTLQDKGARLLSAIPAIPDIIANGRVVHTAPGTMQGVKAIHWIAAPVMIDGKEQTVAVMLREQTNGIYQYDITEAEFDRARKPGGAASEMSSIPALEGARSGLNLFLYDGEINQNQDISPTSDATADLRARMAALGIQDRIALRVSENMGAMVAGTFNPRATLQDGKMMRGLITVALNSPQSRDITLNHESVHAMRSLGLFRADEWSALTRRAQNDLALMKSVKRRYPDLSADAQAEEAIADMFAGWVRAKNLKGLPARAFDRILSFISSLRSWMNGNGWASAESIMLAMDSGRLASRESRARVTSGEANSLFEEPEQPKKTMTDAERAELDARQQQSMARRGGQQGLGDQEGGLFSSERDQGTLFSYENAPDTLLGFSSDASRQKGFGQNRYPIEQDVRVTINEDTFDDTIEGLNGPHAMERARRNWPGAKVEAIGAPRRVEKFSIVADGESQRVPARDLYEGHAGALTDMMDAMRGSGGPLTDKAVRAWENVRTKVQDRFYPLLRLQKAVERDLGKPLEESANPYLGEELMTGRIGARMEALNDEVIEPLFDAMEAEGVSVDDLETYLYARHAPERNARIAEINPEFKDGGGSGMTDIEAAAIMNRIRKADKMEAMERLAARVDEMLDASVKSRVEAGLMSEADLRQWRENYQFYVPLRGKAEVEGMEGLPAVRGNMSSGITVKGKESKRAFGRRSRADSPLAYSILQAQEAIARSETNKVAREFYELAKIAPDPAFWTIDKVERRPIFNKASGQVEYRNESRISAEDAPYTVTAKIDGVEHRITMNRDNPEAIKLATAMRNLTAQKLGWLVQIGGKVNRFLSMVNTSLNPEFVVTNALRDIQAASITLNAQERDGLVRGMVKDYSKALVASMKGSFGKQDGEWGKWYREFMTQGGRVYFNQFEDLDTIKTRIEKQMKLASDRAAGRISLKRGFHEVLQFVENANGGVENAVRLSAYKNAREAGMSMSQAASLAKNLTVNFNRRGEWGAGINAAYLFFNASVQGSATIIGAAKSKRVQKLLGSIVIAGAVVEMMNAMISGDDDDGESYWDKVSSFDKSRNIVLMMPGGEGKFIKIPMPYGYNAFFNLGRGSAEIARRGGEGWKGSVGDILTGFIDAFNPIGGTESLLNLIAPTLIDPLVDLQRNRDFADRPIMPEQSQYGPQEPDAQRYFGSVAPHWKAVTDFLTDMTGGDKIVPGAIDVSPETLEYLQGVGLGAAGQFFDRLLGLGGKLIGADPEAEISANDFPFYRKVIGDTPRSHDKSAFYDRINEVETALDRAKGYAEREDEDGMTAYVLDNEKLFEMEAATKQARKDMREIRKAKGKNQLAHELGKIDDATYRSEATVFKSAEDMVVQGFNTQWNAVMKPSDE